MEIEVLTCGHPGMLLRHRSRPVLGSLLLTLGKFWTPLHFSTSPPVHLPSHHRSLFGGKVKLQTLNKRFLGGTPSFYSLSKKKEKCVFPLSPPLFHFGVIGTPLPLVFFFVFFIEDNENLKHGGVSSSLFRLLCGILG